MRERVLGAEWNLALPSFPHLLHTLQDLRMYPVTIKHTHCDLILNMGFPHTLTQPWAMLEKPDDYLLSLYRVMCNGEMEKLATPLNW